MRAVQTIWFPVLFPLKDSCIEVASMGSVSTYIHLHTEVEGKVFSR